MTFYNNALQWIYYFIFTALSVILCYLLYWYTKKRRSVMLIDKIPGPKTVFFLGNMLPLLKTPHEEWYRTIIKELMCVKDCPLMRFRVLNDGLIFLNDPQTIQTVLNSNDMLDKASTYKYVEPWIGGGLITSTGEKWRSRRKLITPTFHFGILDEFFKVQLAKADDLVDVLKTVSDKDYFDVAPYVTRHTLEVICETAMGISMHENTDRMLKYLEAVNGMVSIVALRKLFPWLGYDFIFHLSSAGRRQKKYLKILHGFTNQVIKERWAEISAQPNNKGSRANGHSDDHVIGRKRRVAFLDMLLEIYKDKQNLTFEDIREEVDTFMFAGHDTTSAGISWMIYNVGRFPDIQQRVHDELDAVFGNSKRQATKEDMAELKYLDLVIKESLRILPSVPFFSRRIKEDMKLCGYTVPAGTILGFHTYIMHRNEKYFPDPEKFDPDRFLPENSVDRHPYAYVPFSAGLRNCIGQRFALLEIKTTIVQVLRHFKITTKHHVDELKLVGEAVLRSANGIWIKLERRELH